MDEINSIEYASHTHTHMCVNHMFVGQPVGKKSIDRDSPGVLEAKPEVAEMGITPSHAPMATRAETSAKSRQTSCNQQTNGEIFSGHLERKIDNLSTRQNKWLFFLRRPIHSQEVTV